MKRITSLLGAFLLLGVLPGCGGGGSSTSTSNNGNNGGGGGGSSLPAGTELLYVGDNVGMIHGFGVDPNSGKLTALGSVSVTSGAAAADVGLAADLGGMVLYATSAGVGGPNVASFIVNKTTGALTPAGVWRFRFLRVSWLPSKGTSTLSPIPLPTRLRCLHSESMGSMPLSLS